MPYTSPMELSHSDISAAYSNKVTTQSYKSQIKIDGVQIFDLKPMTDDGGMFAELMRFSESGESELISGFRPRQSSFSVVQPGAVKAFHLHYKQDDVWFVPPLDRMLVGLIDVRASSATEGVSMRLVLGAGRAQLLFIPRGVGHGVTNLALAPGSVFYFVNQQFDLSDPDEHRLPFDLLGEDFWKMTPG